MFHSSATAAPRRARVVVPGSRRALLRAGLAAAILAAPAIGTAQVMPARPDQAARRSALPEEPGDSRRSDDRDALVTFPGGIMWQATLPAQPASAPAFDDTRLYVPLRDATLHAVALETGLPAWAVPQAATIAPVAVDGRVVGAVETTLWGRVAATGAPAWSRAVETAPAYAVAVAGGRVLFARGETVSAIRAADGAPLWSRALGAEITARLVADDERAFAGTTDGRVIALALDSGDVRWTRTVGGRVLTVSAGDHRVAAGTDANQVVLLDAGSGARKWKWRLGGDPLGLASFNRKRVFYVSLDNALRAHGRGNGHLAWARNLDGRPMSGPVWLGDRLLVAGVTNELRAYYWRDGTPAGVVGVPARVIHQPFLAAEAGGVPARLVVVLASGEVQALGTTPEPPLAPLATLPGVPLVPDTVKKPAAGGGGEARSGGI